jgi:hypothetical protein
LTRPTRFYYSHTFHTPFSGRMHWADPAMATFF